MMKKHMMMAIAITLILQSCSKKQDMKPDPGPSKVIIPQKPDQESKAPSAGTIVENGDVVHTSINQELSYNKFITIDADGNGKNDFYFTSALVAYQGTSHLYLLASPVSASGSRLALETGPELIINGQFVKALAQGVAIENTPASGSSWNSFLVKGILLDVLQGNTANTISGPWAADQDKYLAMELKIEGKTHYGWIRLKHSLSEEKVTIIGFAYSKIPGQKILAGQGTPTAPIQQKHLIRQMEWKTYQSKAELFYNADSTLKSINYMGRGSSYALNFIHQQKKTIEMNLGPSLYKQEFSYSPSGQLSHMKTKEEGTNRYTQDLEYLYDRNGTLATVNYYQLNEAGKHLVYNNTYSYDQAGQLNKIVSLDKNGAQSITTIDAYSAPFWFDPFWFISPDLNEYYLIFNLPVLSSMKGLPAVIKYTRFNAIGQPYVEKLSTINYTINQGRLEKQTETISYPAHPVNDTSAEVIYTY